MSLIKHTSQFTTISNHILQSKTLSWKSKGLYAYLNSKPNNWNFSIERIAKEASDSVYSTEMGIKELKQFGLLIQKTRSKINDQNKRVFDGQEYHLYSEIKEPSGSISAPPNFRHTETPPPRDSATHNKTIYNKTEYNKTERIEPELEVQSKTPNSTPNLNINSLSDFFKFTQDQKEDMEIFKILNNLNIFFGLNQIKITDLEIIKETIKSEEYSKNYLSKKHWGGWIGDYQTQKAQDKVKQFTITKDPNFGKTKLIYEEYLFHYSKKYPNENAPEFTEKYYF